MDHFSYIEGRLHAEQVPCTTLAESVGTPLYVYSRSTFCDHYDRLAEAFAPLDPLICYSIKSCSNLSICRLLGERGAGMDLVSGGELHRAELAGIDPARCVYAGVGKTDAEIIRAIKAGVGWLNVESEAEFENISRLASKSDMTCQAALRINPDVDPMTHRYTTTGKKETKFGVDIQRARAFFKSYGHDPHCRLAGLHLHIGSPVYSPEPYVRSIEKALELIDELKTEGYTIDTLDLGGGFGANYETDQSPIAADYASHIVPLLESRVTQGLKIILEPGRSISANAGVLLLKVLYVKTSGDKTFVICDGGMNILLRPSHYDAFHFIWPCEVCADQVPLRREMKPDLPGLIVTDVVGPICETGDFLALDRPLPPVKRGEVLAVFSAGAYGMSMANRYNSMPLPAEVLVDGDRVTQIRGAESYEDLVQHELKHEPIVLKIEEKAGRP
ncbi:MAG: diaminopimelate decarboxylase [Planctomycetota bacterium]|nr:diaminopimelate decarboxylase [Planctomycetota bacterium]